MRKCKFKLSGKEEFGYFHQFGIDCMESEDGNIQWTIAIIEDKNGRLHNISFSKVHFVPDDLSRHEYDEHKSLFGW